jgi:transcriptional regulator with XRE-family HTH domain
MAQTYPAAYAPFAMAKGRRYNERPTVPGTFGHFLRAERDARNWSQEALADAVGDGMSGADVSNIERGKIEVPTIRRMIAIARALDMPVTALYVAAGYPEFGEHSRRGYSRTIVEDEQHRAS